ncbi:MAG: GNAT family N-acetyltransferase [Candidatus Cloacimonadota bacterium]|nr:MAG: GNAT family N-acetyltransferase [Candidatus Cloacimonadota bacterium]
MEIKFLTYDDGIEDVFRIREKVFVEEQAVPIEEEIDATDKISTHILIFDKGIPVGTGRVFEKNGKWYIGRVAVINEQRGKGIGKLIMKKLMGFANKRGAKRIFIHSQTYICDFYRNLGFTEHGSEFMDAGIPHIEMHKDI